MPAVHKNAAKDEYVYSDESFDESYHSDGDIAGRNHRRGKKRKNSSLSFLPSNVKDDVLRQWCHEQITRRKTLQNKVGELNRKLEEMLEENRDLRKQVRFGEKSLQKMERDQKNMPFVLREHSADIRRLRKNMDDEHKSKEDLEKRNRKISDELVRMRDENRELKRIINDKDLNKKQYDLKMIEESDNRAHEAERRNEEIRKALESEKKNHQSEVNRSNYKVRNLTIEKDDLERVIKDLESKLQEKDKELAIHYIYAQRLTKPPPRLTNTPPRGILVNKQIMTDPDCVLESVKRDNLLLKQEVTNLRATLEGYGATAKFLDEEKDKLEREQMERERKEKEFKEEMERSRQSAEAEERRRREELEAEAERDRMRREEEAERKRVEEEERIERERMEWEKSQRRKIEEEVIREIKTHYQRRLQQVDGQITSQLREKKKDEIAKIGGGSTQAGGGGLVSKTTGREGGRGACQHNYQSQPATNPNHKPKACQRCQRRESGVGKTGSGVSTDAETATKTAGGGRRSQERTTAEQVEEH